MINQELHVYHVLIIWMCKLSWEVDRQGVLVIVPHSASRARESVIKNERLQFKETHYNNFWKKYLFSEN